MPKITMTGELVEALRALGIEPNNTQRVIIDIQNGRAPAVYVMQVGTDALPDVLFGLADLQPDVWERRPADVHGVELIDVSGFDEAPRTSWVAGEPRPR